MEKEILLAAKNLTFRYFEQSKRPVLDNLSLELPKGSVTLLTGDSGCGKSTLASILAGLLPKNGGFLQSGTVKIRGENILEMPENKRVCHISMMFQNCDLQFCMDTLQEELRFCLENIAIPPTQMDERSLQAVRQTGMEPFLDRPLHSLSGGEKQKAALTCILALNGSCLILDEPFANLDPGSAEEIIDLLKKIRQEKDLTILAIDHQWKRWEGFADRIARMEGNGVIQILSQPQHSDFVPEQKKTVSLRERHQSKTEKPIYHLEKITLFAGTRKKTAAADMPLLSGASATFPAGSITAILGKSGAGKTTLFEAMLGLRSYEGTIQFQGKEVREYKNKELYSKAGIVFQNPMNQFVTQGVLDEILFSLKRTGKKIPQERLEEKALSLLEQFQLKNVRHRSPFMLSQGQQRRLAVLSMLANHQQILLLDEPTYGQDDRSSEAIMDLLEELVRKQNLTVILSTHDEELACRWADQIYRLEDGQIKLVSGVAGKREESA